MELATVYGPTGDIREANARLIAAAPELLEACKALIFGGEAPLTDPRHVDMTDAIHMIRKALAKAEGRQP